MPRARQYATNAERQRAYRARQQRRIKRMELAARRSNRNVTIHDSEFSERDIRDALDWIEAKADEIIEPEEEDYQASVTLRWLIKKMRRGIRNVTILVPSDKRTRGKSKHSKSPEQDGYHIVKTGDEWHVRHVRAGYLIDSWQGFSDRESAELFVAEVEKCQDAVVT